MTNRIELKFEKANTRLAGNDYGREIYIAQVKDKVNYDDIIYIVFPDQIVNIASSFVQGFFEEIVKKVGKLGEGKAAAEPRPGQSEFYHRHYLPVHCAAAQ